MQFLGKIFGSDKKAKSNKAISNDLEKAIEKTVELFMKYPQKGDTEIMDILENEGLERSLAEHLVLFVPQGFTRYLLSFVDSKPSLSDSYIVMHPDTGKEKEYPLNEQKVYLAALAYAPIVSEHREAFFNIAARCAELNAINNALKAGTNLEGAVMSPSVIIAKW